VFNTTGIQLAALVQALDGLDFFSEYYSP